MDTPYLKSSMKKTTKTDEETNDTIETVSNQTKLRIIKDIKMIYKNRQINPNILYSHHKSNMLKGYTTIIGPSETVYEHGFYIFDIIYPTTYPHSPPKFKFRTTYGVRMHPNFYINGKVCLSLINQWRGEGWTSSQNIQGVLLTISSVMTNNALTHEPGINLGNSKYQVEKYEEIITHANLDIAFLKLLQGKVVSFEKGSNYEELYPMIRQYALEHKNQILEKVEKLAISNPDSVSYTGYYYDCHFNYHVDYPKLLNSIKQLYETL